MMIIQQEYLGNSKQTWTWHQQIIFVSQPAFHLETFIAIFLFLVVDKEYTHFFLIRTQLGLHWLDKL